MYKISFQCVITCRRKVQTTVHKKVFLDPKRAYLLHNWRKLTAIKLDLRFIKKSHIQNFNSLCQSIGQLYYPMPMFAEHGELGRSNKFVTDFNFFQTDNFITNSPSIASIVVPMYQENFHLLHYRHFSPNCRSNTRKRTTSAISSNPQS